MLCDMLRNVELQLWNTITILVFHFHINVTANVQNNIIISFVFVVSIDYPGFKWTRGMKYVYAVEMLVASMVYSIALAMPTNNRDLTNYLDYLEALHSISVDRIVGENLEGAEGPAVRRLEEHALGLATANVSLLIGETSTNILRVLNNVKAAMEAGSDTPLASVEADMEYLMDSPTIYL